MDGHIRQIYTRTDRKTGPDRFYIQPYANIKIKKKNCW